MWKYVVVEAHWNVLDSTQGISIIVAGWELLWPKYSVTVTLQLYRGKAKFIRTFCVWFLIKIPSETEPFTVP